MSKRFTTFIIAAAFTAGAACTQRPDVPDTTAIAPDRALSLAKHPFLLMDQAKVDLLRSHMSNDSQDLQAMRNELEKKRVGMFPGYTIPTGAGLTARQVVEVKAGALSRRMEQLALAFVLYGTTFIKANDVLDTFRKDVGDGWTDLMTAIRTACPTQSSSNQCSVWSGYEPKTELSCTVLSGNAFLWSLIAFDLMHETLSLADRDTIKGKLWEFVQPQFVAEVAPWKEAVYSIRGLWSLFYSADTVPNLQPARTYMDLAVDAINDYRRWQDDMMSADGVFTGGPGYAYGRYAAERPIKYRFMDVIENLRTTLEASGKTIPAFYKNPVNANFYEWVYGYRGSPANLGYTFGDIQPLGTSGVSTYAYQMFKYSNRAQAYALRAGIAWTPTDLRLSPYLDRWEYGSNNVAPAVPVLPSRVFKDGGVWLNAGTTKEDALSGALWNIRAAGNNIYNHSHFDINSLNLTAFEQRLFNNVGYFGSPGLGCEDTVNTDCTACPTGTCATTFTGDYVRYDTRANSVLAFDDEAHYSKLSGDGVIDYYSGNSLVSFGTADTGSIGKNVGEGPTAGSPDYIDRHKRTLALVQPQSGKTGYFVIFDEATRKVQRAAPSSPTIDLYFHGGSDSVVANDTSLGQSAYKVGTMAKAPTAVDSYLFFAQEPTNPLPEDKKVAYTLLASGKDVGYGKAIFNKRIRASYSLPLVGSDAQKRVITAVFPTKSSPLPTGMRTVSPLERFASGSTYTGAFVNWSDGDKDVVVESDGSVEIPYRAGTLTFTVKAAFVWARISGGNVTSLMAIRATKIQSSNPATGKDYGFTTTTPISFALDLAKNERWLRLPTREEGAPPSPEPGTLTSVGYLPIPSGTTDPIAYDAQNDLPFQFKGALVGSAADTVPPTVVSTTPTNGAAGIKTDAKLVITFSEPMNRTVTQTAFQSADLGAFSLRWKSDRELEVSSPALQYAQGTTSLATRYTYAMTTAAVDLAGNHLGATYSGTFTTARRITATLPYEKTLWQAQGYAATNAAGSTCQCSTTQDNYAAYIGWMTYSPNPGWCRVVTGYSLSGLPAGAAVESAKLSCSYHSEYNAFANFGDVVVDQIHYESPNLAQGFGPIVPPATKFGTLFGPGITSATVDVTSAVNRELEAGSRALQLRFRFDREPPAPSAAPMFMRFYFNGAGACRPLDVVYLAP